MARKRTCSNEGLNGSLASAELCNWIQANSHLYPYTKFGTGLDSLNMDWFPFDLNSNDTNPFVLQIWAFEPYLIIIRSKEWSRTTKVPVLFWMSRFGSMIPSVGSVLKDPRIFSNICLLSRSQSYFYGRSRIVAAHWKMNVLRFLKRWVLQRQVALAHIKCLKWSYASVYTNLFSLMSLNQRVWKLRQNCNENPFRAHTGDISAQMLKISVVAMSSLVIAKGEHVKAQKMQAFRKNPRCLQAD